MIIGIISDTHGVLRETVITQLKRCDIILHAGDFHTVDILDRLQEIAPVYAVRGNNDKGMWADKLPIDLAFRLGQYHFYMVHQIKDVQLTNIEADFIIVGHSHRYMVLQEEQCFLINPGSCGRKRFKLELTMAVMELEHSVMKIEKIVL